MIDIEKLAQWNAQKSAEIKKAQQAVSAAFLSADNHEQLKIDEKNCVGFLRDAKLFILDAIEHDAGDRVFQQFVEPLVRELDEDSRDRCYRQFNRHFETLLSNIDEDLSRHVAYEEKHMRKWLLNWEDEESAPRFKS